MWRETELRPPRESQGSQAGPELWAGHDARGGGSLSVCAATVCGTGRHGGSCPSGAFDLSFNTAPEFMLDWDGDGLRLQFFPA